MFLIFPSSSRLTTWWSWQDFTVDLDMRNLNKKGMTGTGVIVRRAFALHIAKALDFILSIFEQCQEELWELSRILLQRDEKIWIILAEKGKAITEKGECRVGLYTYWLWRIIWTAADFEKGAMCGFLVFRRESEIGDLDGSCWHAYSFIWISGEWVEMEKEAGWSTKFPHSKTRWKKIRRREERAERTVQAHAWRQLGQILNTETVKTVVHEGYSVFPFCRRPCSLLTLKSRTLWVG